MSVLSSTTQKQVEEKLIQEGLVDSDKLELLHSKSNQSSIPLFSLLTNEGGVDPEDLTRIIATVADIPYVNLSNVIIEPEVLDLLPHDFAERYMAVPLGRMQNKLVVAMLDADNVQAVDFLSSKIGQPLKVYSASERGIRAVLAQYSTSFTTPNEESSSILSNDKQKTVKTIVQDSPISKALSTILEYAAINKASDVHIESLEKELKIRVRIDGVLHEIMKLPKSMEAPLVSRVKILSNLKIDEHRVPQDGQFTIRVDNREIDLRIAISPVVWGEQVVIRLLDKTGVSFALEDMGYKGRALRTIKKNIKNANGMILTSGPTGSGKSTSLYALIQEIKDESINIVTLEDPVEYKMNGVNQIQVNPEVGLTFASGLRSILRQDPNVIMVGEIRDSETASLAVQAALTGHLVLSTLHTNSAAGILPRLLDMDIEPFLIASTVRAVIGQRLVRRVNKPEAYQSDNTETAMIKKYVGGLLPPRDIDIEGYAKDLGYDSLPLSSSDTFSLYRGKDVKSPTSGYKGRLGLYEVLEATESIQELIMKRASSAEIQSVAQSEGMVTMQQDGILKALSGETTLSEVSRVVSEGSI